MTSSLMSAKKEELGYFETLQKKKKNPRQGANH